MVNIPALVLKKWLDHTDIHITLDTYADVFDSMYNDSINKIDNYILNITVLILLWGIIRGRSKNHKNYILNLSVF